METKGIIISQKDYERLTELEKNFDNKVKENKESFKKGLEDAIKGNLVKLLWVKDKYYAEIMGCDLSEEGVCEFISKEDADMLASTNSKVSYDRNDVLKDNAKKKTLIELKTTMSPLGFTKKLSKTKRKLFATFGGRSALCLWLGLYN